jgi:predicted dithiol-disulfide oxidoreductase (DUF899 family)
MAKQQALEPAADLAKKNRARFPNESQEYRRARNALLADEIELRRHIERVAETMFGPKRERPCPMCTSLMSSWEEKVPDIEQRVALFAMARSPIDRLVAAKRARGWSKLKVVSDTDGDFTREYVSAEDADIPGYHVFTRKGGTIRHFWSGEMNGDMADPGQDPRGAPDMDPLWAILDTTPEGRGADWYPKLEYDENE